MQRVVAGARQHTLLSLLQPWATENASMRAFGTSGLKVERGRALLYDSPDNFTCLRLCSGAQLTTAAFWSADLRPVVVGILLPDGLQQARL